MYRVAQKPVYRVQQKVLVSVAWRCCPGFRGPDCEDYDPTANSEPTEPSGELPGTWDQLDGFELGHPVTEFSEIKEPQGQREHLLQNLQNDAQLVEDGIPGPWEALASNVTAETTETNQTEFEFSGGLSEQPLQPHVNAVLQAHIDPIWKSFSESLHSLSQAIRNLSLEVEANRQAVKTVQEDTMTRADLQELGAKFDAKVQENNQRVGQLWQDVEEQLHAQRRSLHHALSEVQTEMSTKLKQLVKAQELPGANGSLVVAASAAAAARPEPESLQARLGQLQRNISALHRIMDQREEALQGTLKNMDSVLSRHVDEIKELYSESDETFDQISKVERQVEELLVNHTGLRELRVILMEKSLIMEENKVELEEQLLELNLTLQHLQVGHADLIKYVKDCHCQRLNSDVDIIREGQRDAMRFLEETQVSLDERHQLDDSSLRSLQSTVDAMSSAMDEHKGESERARAERARMRSQLRALEHAVEALKTVANQTRREMRQLHSSFAALLEDALRHQAVLTALFGEETMEEMSEEAPRPLPLNYDQIRLALRDAASGLQEQAFGWNALATRVEVLEQAVEQHPQLTEQLEPSHDPGREEEATALANLEQEIQRLNSDVKQVGQCCEASWAASLNGSLEDLHSMVSDTRHSLRQHQQLFHSLFQNFQELVANNISLDLGKLHAMLSKKEKKQLKGLGASRKREKKQVVISADAHAKGMEKGVLDSELWEAGSPVAFYATSSEAATALQMVKFSTTSINVGSSYFPEHGYFRAPQRGVYLFAVSITFGPGPGTGQLVFEGHHRVPVYSTEQRGGSTATTFAMSEMQKGERVWFELIQGSITKGSQPHTAFGGFLVFKT